MPRDVARFADGLRKGGESEQYYRRGIGKHAAAVGSEFGGISEPLTG